MSMLTKSRPNSKGHALMTQADSLRAVLDALRANVFVADMDHNMIYANPQAIESLTALHGPIDSSFGVDSKEMVGGSIHRFHRDPERIKQLLGSGTNFPRHASFTFGETTLHTEINAVKNSSGEMIGYCVVWTDASWDEKVGDLVDSVAGRADRDPEHVA